MAKDGGNRNTLSAPSYGELNIRHLLLVINSKQTTTRMGASTVNIEKHSSTLTVARAIQSYLKEGYLLKCKIIKTLL